MRVAFESLASRVAYGSWVRAATLLCSLGMAIGCLAPTVASAAGRHATMIIDANSGQVLHAQAADEQRYPASLTKMMTIFLAFEMMEQGRLTPTTRIKISEEAASTSPSKLGLAAGSDIAAMDAIRALIVKSANDIAVALGEHMAGSELKFAALMTRRARELGMAATTFRNAHGLPDPGQVTTARDMLTLALALNDRFPQQYRLFSLASFSYGGNYYRNHNTMLHSFAGMDGLKTGYTTPSGFNLVASVRRDGRHVVAAVFGGSTAGARNAHMRTILLRALPKASTERTRKPATALVAAKMRRPVATTRTSPEPAAPKLVEAIRPATPPPARTAATVPNPVAPPPARLAPQAVAQLQRPTPAPPAPETATDAKPVAAAPPVAADIEPETSANAPIQMAQVRRITVPPQARQFAAPVALMPPAGPAAPQAGESSPHAPFPVATPLNPPSQPAPSVAARAVAAAQPSPQATMPLRGAAGVTSFAPATPPSTLQAQAERLENRPVAVASATGRQVAPPTFRLAGPTAAAPTRAPDAGRISIQVGAYASAADATRQLDATKAKSGALLAQATPLAQTVTSGGRQLYRARFTGFDAPGAAAACNELRRLQIDCQVARD